MENRTLKIKNYVVDENLFNLGLAMGCNPNDCTGECCSDGVYISLEDHKKILEYKDVIKKHMDETQTIDESVWFETQTEQDADFPGGVCIGTQVYNDKCVFLNKEKRCVLQVTAVSLGLDRWAIKPFYCIAFPIVVAENVLTFDDMMNDKAPCCTAKESLPENIIDACKDEFVYILGEEHYCKLTELLMLRKGIKTYLNF
ncbi:MAG: DUF3109 family protein [Bacteroidota bacterium]|nr:DUF3109 family protein [Bacteroidota bacterium]